MLSQLGLGKYLRPALYSGIEALFLLPHFSHAWGIFKNAFSFISSSVLLPRSHDWYEPVTRWYMDKFANSRVLRADPVRRNELSRPRIYVSTLQVGKRTLSSRFEPVSEWHIVWHRYRPFFIKKWERDEYGSGGIAIRTLGWSAQPCKAFLESIVARYEDHKSTFIYMPSNIKDSEWELAPWDLVAVRPVRDVDSVIMDYNKKNAVIDGISTFLKPETEQWHIRKGVPHRLGYLFYGPPGTGKTSFAKALSGLFGLRLYLLTIENRTHSEISRLLTTVPKQSLILLEDVDAASGFRSRDKHGDGEDQGKHIAASLLNAIDGVIAPEGVVVVLSTNHPELLDRALTRPGRIDKTVEFNLATKDQIRNFLATETAVDADNISNMIPADTPAELQSLVIMLRDTVESPRDTPKKVEKK